MLCSVLPVPEFFGQEGRHRRQQEQQGIRWPVATARCRRYWTPWCRDRWLANSIRAEIMVLNLKFPMSLVTRRIVLWIRAGNRFRRWARACARTARQDQAPDPVEEPGDAADALAAPGTAQPPRRHDIGKCAPHRRRISPIRRRGHDVAPIFCSSFSGVLARASPKLKRARMGSEMLV